MCGLDFKMNKVFVSNKKVLEKTKTEISLDGKDLFHVLCDFDRTLTKAFFNGQKASTVIAQIRNGDYLTPDYSPEAHKLFDIYHPIEINHNIPIKEKKAKMQEWWKKHFELLIECGFNKKLIDEIVKKRELPFRERALEFIDFLHEKGIPLIIMSAGPGDMISEYLRQEGRLYENVHIIANFFKFNRKGEVSGLTGKIIHSLNKDEAELRGSKFYQAIKQRRNVLLLGDSMEDIKMIHGFDYSRLIKIGYLNEGIKENLEEFKQEFDVTIPDDGSFEYPYSLVKEMFG